VKRFIAAIIASAAAICAQQSSVTTTTSVDINGRRVAEGPAVVHTRSDSRSETTELLQSVNGRQVPIERVEEHVLRDDASGRLVERIIRRFDQTGSPTAPLRETIEETKQPDGSSTTQVTTYRGDINGRMQVIEKSTTDVRKSGTSENADTVVQRPTVNGSLETVEKQSKTTVQQSNGYHQDETIYRRDANGSFATAVRRTTEHTEQSGQASDNTAQYEIGSSGQLQLQSQKVTKTVTAADGSKDLVVDIFGQNVPGTVDPGGLKLQEQQLIQRKTGPNETVVETLSVRRPSVSDPRTLGPARQISETVCRGKCNQ
jgi:hypothetical protein